MTGSQSMAENVALTSGDLNFLYWLVLLSDEIGQELTKNERLDLKRFDEIQREARNVEKLWDSTRNDEVWSRGDRFELSGTTFYVKTIRK